jgi:hypothetical protein
MALNAEQLNEEISLINKELVPLVEEYNAFINVKKPPLDELFSAKSRFEKQLKALN